MAVNWLQIDFYEFFGGRPLDNFMYIKNICGAFHYNHLGGTSDPKADQMSSLPDVVLMPVPTSELRSTGPNLVPLLATRCLYWGTLD